MPYWRVSSLVLALVCVAGSALAQTEVIVPEVLTKRSRQGRDTAASVRLAGGTFRAGTRFLMDEPDKLNAAVRVIYDVYFSNDGVSWLHTLHFVHEGGTFEPKDQPGVFLPKVPDADFEVPPGYEGGLMRVEVEVPTRISIGLDALEVRR